MFVTPVSIYKRRRNGSQKSETGYNLETSDGGTKMTRRYMLKADRKKNKNENSSVRCEETSKTDGGHPVDEQDDYMELNVAVSAI